MKLVEQLRRLAGEAQVKRLDAFKQELVKRAELGEYSYSIVYPTEPFWLSELEEDGLSVTVRDHRDGWEAVIEWF